MSTAALIRLFCSDEDLLFILTLLTQPKWTEPHKKAEPQNRSPSISYHRHSRKALKSFKSSHASTTNAQARHSRGLGLLKPPFYEAMLFRRYEPLGH